MVLKSGVRLYFTLCSILAGPIATDFSQSYSDYLARSYIQVGSYGNFIWTPKGKKGSSGYP